MKSLALKVVSFKIDPKTVVGLCTCFDASARKKSN